MNPENYQPANEEDLTQERLDDSLFRFADLLSGHRWDKRKAHGVSMSHSVTEFGKATVTNEEITKRTTYSFKADKSGGIAGDVDFGTPRYVVASKAEEDLFLEDLPATVRKEMLEEAYEKGSAVHKVVKEFAAPKDYEDVLGDLPLQSRAKQKFVVADGGEIVRHTVSHRYAFEDAVLMSAAYSSSTGSMDWQRLDRPEGFAVELRPQVLLRISEDEATRERELLREREGLDSELEQYFFDKSLTEMLRIKGEPAASTVRQILGILAVLSSDMKHYKP